jgi:hypothetical protein
LSDPLTKLASSLTISDVNLDRFEVDGFVVVFPLVDAAACIEIGAALAQVGSKGVGIRDLLEFSWCVELAQAIRAKLLMLELLPSDSVAVQCTYFEKSRDQNWLVAVHQDLSIPVREKIDHAALFGWSKKEETIFVQPPDEILQTMVAVRLHIDDCGPEDGPLRVVPGSHQAGRLSNAMALHERDRRGECVCTVERGGAMLMKPLLLHASFKATGNSKRRVLHFIFGPRTLPYGLKWKHAV